MNGKREYGDYQTPDSFAFSVCKYLKEKRKIRPQIVIEPTCGIGSFIKNNLKKTEMQLGLECKFHADLLEKFKNLSWSYQNFSFI